VSRRRKLGIALGALMVLVLGLGAAALMIVRSAWFYEKVRARLLTTVENATGGRAEMRGFTFDWHTLHAEVRDFTLHGREAAGKPPLFHAASISVGLKIVSALKRDIDVQYLDVQDPRVYLIVYPDGRTNVPEPKVKGNGNTVEDILKLAIGRFSLRNGWFEVESRGATPFDLEGRKLAAQFGYDTAGPRYRGTIAIDPLDLRLSGRAAVPIAVHLAVEVERNRIALSSATIATGATSLELSGALDDLNAPRASFQYDAKVSLGDIARVFDADELRAGAAQLGGSGSWSAAAGLSATGNLRAAGVHYQDRTITLRNGRLDGAVTAGPEGIDVSGVRVAVTYFTSHGQAPGEGRIEAIQLRRGLLDLHGVALAVLGGNFQGEARLRDWKHYTVTGDIAAIAARKVVGLYSPEPLPWDGLASGPVRIEGTFKDKRSVRATGTLAIEPADGSAPVHGQLNAKFDGDQETVNVGSSTLTLPSSHADFLGVYGKLMRVHLESTDLNDLLPILGQNANDLPVKLQHGSASFDGTVTGQLAAPRFDGRLVAKSFTVVGQPLDWLDAEVTASPETAQLRNATAARGTLRTRFDLQAALHDWKLPDESMVFGNARVENAPLPELLVEAGAPELPATGIVTGSTQLTGTFGRPIFKGDFAVVKGALRGEPFDRLAATYVYANDGLEIAGGRITAGPKQVELTGTYRHPPGRLDTGRLVFRASTNVMPLESIATLQEARPGAKGSVQVSANGEVDIGSTVRIASLHADVNGRGLALAGQALGDARFTAETQGQLLHTRLEANVANSAIHGDGSWKLEGDYPGSAVVTFSRVDFGQLRAWIAPSQTGTAGAFAGFAEGEMRIEGPALKPEAMRAELRLPSIEIGPPPTAGLPANLTLRNSGPVVATLANYVLTVQNARLTGRATDVAVSGRVLLQNDRSPLDLRVAGKVDLGIVHDFDPDFVASGALVGDAGVRGKPEAPLITGRVQVQNAALNVVDFPNGLSNANGTILFTGDRATIEKLTGETGGGKVELSGFVSYPGDVPVFQLQATANQVRVRYPEGVSTVANADLRLAGTSDRSTVTGAITILRTGFNPQSDFSSVIAKSAEPVRTPPARTGLLGGMNFDVQIESAPDIQFQSSLTQDLQVEANLRLRGNASNPALLGRINITQGQMVFFGTRYNINQGSVAFFNPLKIDPILDIDLETKARGVDITLTVSGPLNKLNLTPRSDPPLQFNEIVALLATGRAPSASASQLSQQVTSPQAYQQLGASALLGQAIASPVAGRLQRFFGVSKLRIDPTLPGVENNPQARLTVEQQVTPDVTITYITNITNVNAQSVRVEWSVTKQWSVVFLREENGVNSLDFLYKKRF
jgi:translocation and assembly module TamB